MRDRKTEKQGKTGNAEHDDSSGAGGSLFAPNCKMGSLGE